MWTWQRQQQQRGAQLHARGDDARRPGEAPREAVEGREAQDHDYADLQVSGGEPQRDIDYPATNPPDRKGDITPSVPDDATQSWDEVVQPERREPDTERKGKGDEEGFDDLPLPDGK